MKLGTVLLMLLSISTSSYVALAVKGLNLRRLGDDKGKAKGADKGKGLGTLNLDEDCKACVVACIENYQGDTWANCCCHPEQLAPGETPHDCILDYIDDFMAENGIGAYCMVVAEECGGDCVPDRE
jgi:hypothetical protein